MTPEGRLATRVVSLAVALQSSANDALDAIGSVVNGLMLPNPYRKPPFCH